MTLRDRVARLPGAHRTAVWLRSHVSNAGPSMLGPVDYHREILSEEDGNALIGRAVSDARPFMAGRPGTVELDCVTHYLRHRRGGKPRDYPASVSEAMSNNAGFFPATAANLDAFVAEYLAAVRPLDADAVWFNPGESDLAREFCPTASLVPLRSLEPYYHDQPWSEHLAGKRVLVVHPFAESIAENYRSKRAVLFADPRVLPEFDLRVITAVQSIAGQATEYGSWFDALEAMKSQIESVHFEVLIVGAGAYGLPLAAFTRQLGKVAIQMGGATQILFGIRGRRWDDHQIISGFYNEHWTRPKPSETPKNYQRVEDGGAYW